MKVANDFDCARVFPLAIAMMKFESICREGISEFDDFPQFPIVIAGDRHHFAIVTGCGEKFSCRLSRGLIVHEIAHDDESLRLVGGQQMQ